ncbi:hypothetical protein NFI96_006470, partial [Prochilodus magdalenae]
MNQTTRAVLTKPEKLQRKLYSFFITTVWPRAPIIADSATTSCRTIMTTAPSAPVLLTAAASSSVLLVLSTHSSVSPCSETSFTRHLAMAIVLYVQSPASQVPVATAGAFIIAAIAKARSAVVPGVRGPGHIPRGPLKCSKGLCTLGVCLPRQHHYVNESKTWPEAQSYCREHYTDLASIDNIEEGLGLLDLVDVRNSGPTWIGLYDDLSSWRWSLEDDGFYKEKERDFRNWHIWKPTNRDGNNLCAFITTYHMTWNEASCSSTFQFICYDGISSTSVYQYHFVNESKTWTEAQRYCRELYTDLATINNMEEMDMIINTVNDSYSGLAWIGQYDDLDSWRWSLDDDSFYMEGERDYRGWLHEPNNYGGIELCVYMSSSGTWFDIRCDTHITFVCYDGRAGSENYIWITQGMYWPDAQHYCREHHTDLASVRNWTENQRIVEISDTGFCTGSSCDPHQYHFINEPMTWAAAQRYCRETYTDLATFDNAQEVNRLLMTVKDTYSGLAWIGLYDDLNNWRWSLEEDGFYKENERNFRNWYKEKPQNYGGDSLCVYFQSSKGVWYGCPCGYKFTFICYDGSVNASQRYVVVYEGMVWTEAQRYCREHHTDLWTDENCDVAFPFLCYSDWSSRQYHFISEGKTWTEAQRYCRELYTDLATIDNMEEMNMIINTVNGSYSGLAWIGLYDDLDSWRWSLDDDSFYMEGERDYRVWYHQPDNYNGNELCVHMSGTGEWYDDDCTYNLRFVCYDVPPPPQGFCTLGVCLPRQYHYVNEYKTWPEAQSYCREHYTDLASIDNAEEGLGLLNLVDVRNSSPTWIGLYANLNTWRWSLEVDGFYKGDERNFRNWHIQKPVNWDGKSLCTYIAAGDMTWHEGSCSLAFPFICYDGSVNASQRYVVVQKYMNWTKAQRHCREYYTDLISRYCRELYTDLATIDNMEEMNMIINTVNGSYSGLAWIGLYDDLDSWRWSLDDDGFYMEGERDYRGWYQEPNNNNGTKHCVYLSSSGTWFAKACDMYYTFVCYDGRAGSENYIWINKGKSWPDAQHYCREHYTDLASVRNWTENQRILNMSGQWTDEDCSDTLPFVCYNRVCTETLCISHQYHFINEPMTWAAAQSYCRENYTDLATFDNVQEVNRLLMTVKDTYSGLAWIGLYDDLNSWRWSLDKDGFYKENERNFRNWYIHKPWNPTGNNFCVNFYSKLPIWREYPCQYKSSFICYDGSVNASERYVVVSENMNWTEAQRYCRGYHTDLVSVRNETENRKLISVLKKTNLLNVWIGLYRTRSWSDGNNSSFSNWRPGQPDNAWGNEHCTAASFKYFGQWTDEDCDQAFPFICYSDLPSRQYHFVNESKTWTEAQTYCRELYTDLATIDNMEEMNMIINTVNGSYSGLAWIGLYDDLDSWRWSLDDDSFYMEGERDYRGWYHEPDNFFGKELCVVMFGIGKWYDNSCTNKFGFVCYNGFCTLGVCLPRQYHYVNKSKTWPEAQSYCREHYTDLASIDTAEEGLGLLNLVDVKSSGPTWIGLYDDLNSWRWSLEDDGFYKGNERNYRNWHIWKPINWYGNSHCALISSIYKSWEGFPCSSTFQFICYDGSVNASQRYVVVSENKNWTEAQSYCRKHYTDLVSVRNETENQKLKSLTENKYYYFLWIGLYRTRSWSDGSNSTFSNWRPGQPDNYEQNEYCTAVSFSTFGQWTDENCDQTFPFLCYSGTSARQYRFVNESKTWTEAQKYCRELYTDLATIDNIEEMNMIINTVNGSYSGLAWIGLYDDLDSWRWSLDDDSFYMEGQRDYRVWYQEPDNIDGNELCVCMSSGTWFDEPCDTHYTFICYDGRAGSENYIWINQNKSWPDAQRYCREHYTDLASVRNWTENQRILDISGGFDVWIGLYRTRIWSDQHYSTYENWRPELFSLPEEPGKCLHVPWEQYDQHCTAVSFSDSGLWTDEDCLATLPFVCYNNTRFCTGSLCVPHQYHFINEPMTWAAAQTYCREAYTDLATFDNEQEVKGLLMTVKDTYSGLAWIGLYDLSSWRWSLNQDGFYKENERNFRNWYIQKPENWGGDRLCVYFQSSDGIWYNYPCGYKLTFICYDGSVNASDKYVLVYEYMNWTEAQRYCREHHTDLWTEENCDQAFPFLCYSDWPSCQYYFVEESKTWTEARRYCRELYTDLATINNMEEMNMLINTVNGRYSGLAWIGLYDDLDSWRWSLDDDSFYMEGERDYRGWYREPNNYYGKELCVHMSGTGEWYDDDCTYNLGFVCYD